MLFCSVLCCAVLLTSQAVVSNLGIHHIEFKDETDPEISQHTFAKVSLCLVACMHAAWVKPQQCQQLVILPCLWPNWLSDFTYGGPCH